MGQIDWTRWAPALGLLAALAGITGLLYPPARVPSLAALLFFGMVTLFAWADSVRRDRQQGASVQSLSQEISTLKREIEQQRTALDDLADGLDSMLFLVDHQFTILYANITATQVFRFQDPVGKTLLAVTLSPELTQEVQKCIETAAPINAELTLRTPEEHNVLVKAWPDSGYSDRTFVTLTDITGLRRLERIRRDFVANVSHELRTPMTTIRAMAETIHDDLDGKEPESRLYLERIIREVDRLTRITSDLLTLSVAESEPPKHDPCDLATMIRSVVSQLTPKATGKGLILQANTPPSVVISGHETQLSQVLINLIDNALNYTSEGSVIATLTQDDQNAVIVIQDTGIGIASEHLNRIFERFYRADKGRSRATGGTGLGLSIVRHIVASHGGTINVESALNRGSTFTVTLPLGPAPQETSPAWPGSSA